MIVYTKKICMQSIRQFLVHMYNNMIVITHAFISVLKLIYLELVTFFFAKIRQTLKLFKENFC